MQVHGAELAQNASLLYVGMLAAVEQAARSLHGLLMCCASQCPPEPAPLPHLQQLTGELRWVPLPLWWGSCSPPVPCTPARRESVHDRGPPTRVRNSYPARHMLMHSGGC